MLMIEKLATRYFAGKASVQAGGTVVTPHDALWAGNIWGDDLFFLPSQPLVPPQRIEAVNEDGTAQLAYPWPGVDAVEADYEIRYVGIIERSTAQSRRVLEQLGDVKTWADVFVATDADRLALETPSNPLRAGFRVLVTEDGLIWAKASGAYGDWLPPAEFQGPPGNPGPYTSITFGPVTTLPAGGSATAEVVVTGPASIRIDLAIPAGHDGLGTVAGIEQGDGIDIDVADPTRPVISLDAAFSDLKDVDFTTDPPDEGDVPVWDGEKFVPGAGGGGGGDDLRAELGGTANAIALTSPAELLTGLKVRFRAIAANTGATTINLNGGGAIACRTVTGAVLPAGYIRTDVDTEAVYDGTYWAVGRGNERGSNSNGEYVRLADGTLTCWGWIDSGAINIASGSIFTSSSVSWAFPAVFAEAPNVLNSAYRLSGGGVVWGVQAGAAVTTTGINQIYPAGTVSGATARVVLEASGRWY